MGDVKMYVAVGEETARGTKQAATVGFLPLRTMPKIKFEPKEEFRKQVRGEDTLTGYTTNRRLMRSWSTTLDMEAYCEAGTTKGILGTILKHFFGKATSSQNAATGQYRHMMYPHSDPFGGGSIAAKALTVNQNLLEGISGMKNYPWVGGRVKALNFSQEPAAQLLISADMFGQYRDATTAELGSAVFPAENIALADNDLKVYTGTITKVGTAPDFTSMTFASATQVYPQKVVLKLENGFTDVVQMGGTDYMTKTRLESAFKVSLDMTFDWEDPASGFSSIDEFNAWIAAASNNNFALHWDSGTQAGTGENYGIVLDLPNMARKNAEQGFEMEKDPSITLSYEGMYDATAKYMAGLLLRNTATAV